LPDDPDIEDMDPIMRAWMFYNWLEDYADDSKLLENQGYLIGSFINPEAVKKALGKDGTTFKSSDEEFEKFSNELIQNSQKETIKPKRRRKKFIKE
jgi:hypothetical protein